MNAPDLSSHFPTEVLQQRAAEQRQRIHESVSELKSSVRETVRERLNVEGYVSQRIWQFVAATALVALVSGYGIAGIFTRD